MLAIVALLVMAYVTFYAVILAFIFGFIWLEDGSLLYRLLIVAVIVLIIKLIRRKWRERKSNG